MMPTSPPTAIPRTASQNIEALNECCEIDTRMDVTPKKIPSSAYKPPTTLIGNTPKINSTASKIRSVRVLCTCPDLNCASTILPTNPFGGGEGVRAIFSLRRGRAIAGRGAIVGDNVNTLRGLAVVVISQRPAARVASGVRICVT